MNRRHALTAMGTVGLGAIIAACSTPASAPREPTASPSSTPTPLGFEDAASCTLSPEQTEGPFYFDVNSIRSDIREDRTGIPLQLAVRVLDSVACTPIVDAVADIWHCDAEGVYSGFGSAPANSTFLRGAQATDADGIAEFTTVYPGWYQGRTVHIHAKVHLDDQTLITTQLYFPEDVNDAVAAEAPYASDSGRDTNNERDAIFDPQMEMTVHPAGEGYRALMTINVRT